MTRVMVKKRVLSVLLLVACSYRVDKAAWGRKNRCYQVPETKGVFWLEWTAVILGPLPKRNKNLFQSTVFNNVRSLNKEKERWERNWNQKWKQYQSTRCYDSALPLLYKKKFTKSFFSKSEKNLIVTCAWYKEKRRPRRFSPITWQPKKTLITHWCSFLLRTSNYSL